MKPVIIKVQEELKENIEQIFGKAFKNISVEVRYTSKKEIADFQTNFALVNSKKIGKNPEKIAEEIIKKFRNYDIIDKFEIAGPGFLNIFIKNSVVINEIKKIGSEKYNFPIDTSKNTIIDYSSPNIAKRMHIGHLRSTIIGDSLKRILKYVGFKVSGDNHLGDWGSRFGKLIVGYNKWVDKEEYEKNPIGELERIYLKFSEEAQLNPELEVSAKEEWIKLQSGDKKNVDLWKSFVEYSLKEFEKIYKKLNIEFDTYYGESFYIKMIPEILEILRKKKIAVNDEGVLTVFFNEKEKLSPCIVRKKDGNSHLYSSTDLATFKYRKDILDIDSAIYVMDERPKEHFRQVFKISEMIGKPYDYEKIHVWFGIMRFEDDVFSSVNEGRLINILDEAIEKAKKIINIKNPELSEEEKSEIAEIIGIGAIKYFDLSQNRMTPISFSWDKVLNFEENTSPYLQYTYARIMSIFRKLRKNYGNYIKNDNLIFEEFNKNERELALALLKFPYAVLKSYESYKPNIIADYLFETAKIFNTFYAADSITKEENKSRFNTKLLLAEKTAYIIKEGLGLLGIDVVERM
ncbi:arginine--tRNA ligase [Leptotrichia sp. OH3620_COT-345]|uniref:arginine--tRNA ligase n=1 Tax=Leptotrichia sp. OH3620_COT-345 TaxID=2491048 RepID=UPI000F6535E5|nr:arginine--tRNA ligase [Leptotrichia sp. OH3620_COT-345]RRD40956.1 arginine--tRNA ligase [Leptotrichia sp. OH3620_COT-345]